VRFVPATVVRSSADGVWITGLPDPAPVIVGGQGFVRDGDRIAAAPAPVAARNANGATAPLAIRYGTRLSLSWGRRRILGLGPTPVAAEIVCRQ
jgi:hypothetical protein